MDKTSIIMVAYDQDEVHRTITATALANIQKYTDRENYELILVDNKPIGDFNRRHHLIDIDKHIKLDNDIGISASRNLGVKESNSITKYLCFIDNDVFVWEGWLNKLINQIETKNLDYIWPHQGYTTREFVKDSYQNDSAGNDDAGCVLIKRESFNRVGGWDEKYGSVHHELAFRRRLSGFGLKGFCTNQVIITHLSGITTFFSKDFDKKYAEEGKLISEN